MVAGPKDRILDAALTLFNEQGSAAISTNHIAEATGMSPGNLYYHFRNKQEIIRAIYDRMEAEWDRVFTLDPAAAPTLGSLERMIADYFAVQARFGFFYRDLPTLLRADDDLSARYRQTRERGQANTKQLIEAFVAMGVLRRPEDSALDDLVQVIWLIADFWPVFVAVGGATDTKPAQGLRLLRQALAPHITGDIE